MGHGLKNYHSALNQGLKQELAKQVLWSVVYKWSVYVIAVGSL